MNKFIKYFDGFMAFMYMSSLSIMDVIVITSISTAASAFHWALFLVILPWTWYSTHQKTKYDK